MRRATEQLRGGFASSAVQNSDVPAVVRNPETDFGMVAPCQSFS
jgi:hypothetical protein